MSQPRYLMLAPETIDFIQDGASKPFPQNATVDIARAWLSQHRDEIYWANVALLEDHLEENELLGDGILAPGSGRLQ